MRTIGAKVKARRLVLLLGAVLAVLAAVLVPLAVTSTHATPRASAPRAPAAPPVRICGQSILDSPWNYDGAAGSYASGTAGLPTYGAPGTDFPSATAGLVVPAGNNTAAAHNDGRYQVDKTVVYFEPGVHQIEANIYAGHNSDYVGGYDSAHGKAVITGVDGGTSTGVGSSYLALETPPSAGSATIDNTWEYLTIENYGASLNGSVMGNVNDESKGASGDTYKYDTIGPNEYGYLNSSTAPAHNTVSSPGNGGGYAIDMGSYNTLEYSCVTQNAQGGWNASYGIGDVIAHNEVSWNGLGEYPDQAGAPGASPYACGCSGGGKMFGSVNADFVGNYVHDNYNVGIWMDFNNTGTLISHNYIADNWAQGIEVEGSYNADIADNTLTGNGWASDGAWPAGHDGGLCYKNVSCTGGDGAVTGLGGGLPYAAIYLPNTGANANLATISVPSGVQMPGCSSSCTVTSRYVGHFYVQGNVLTNNFGNVMVYTDNSRFPDDSDYNSTCGIPLGPLNQRNSTIYYPNTGVLQTAADTSISGDAVSSSAGTKTICSNYGATGGGQGVSQSTSQAPSSGQEVFDETTGKLVGTVGTVTSAESFTLTAAPLTGSYNSGDALVLDTVGGCGPADYYRGGLGVKSGTPSEYYWDNCIWAGRGVTVTGNVFSINANTVTNCTSTYLCGYSSVMASNSGIIPLEHYWYTYPDYVMLASGGLANVFADNAYEWQGTGGFRFDTAEENTFVSRSTWQNTYGQDAGSTFGS